MLTDVRADGESATFSRAARPLFMPQTLGGSYELLGDEVEVARYFDLAASLGIGHQPERTLHVRERIAMKLEKETERYLLDSIKRFFVEDMDEEIGDLKAMRVLDFCTREIGPSIYNQAIADAQVFFQEKVSDLGGVRYEGEFDFWKKR